MGTYTSDERGGIGGEGGGKGGGGDGVGSAGGAGGEGVPSSTAKASIADLYRLGTPARLGTPTLRVATSTRRPG